MDLHNHPSLYYRLLTCDMSDRSPTHHERALALSQLDAGVKLVQTHSTSLLHLKNYPPLLTWTTFSPYDGVITDLEGVGLLIRHADCQATTLYDRRRHVIAHLHVGHRGLVSNLYALTVERMGELYGSVPTDLHVCISPSLGPQWAQYRDYTTRFPASFWDYQERSTYFNFWKLAHDQLVATAIPSDQIELPTVCTYAAEQRLFSYRRNRTSKRLGTLVALLPLSNK